MCGANFIYIKYSLWFEFTLTPLNVVGFVNSDPSFTDHAGVLNGFTDKLSEIYDEKATRSAVGVASLPLNVSVEVQTIFMLNG